MNLNSTKHVYQAVPPYLDNREIPARLMTEALTRVKQAEPDLTDQEIWSKAADQVETTCDMIWFGTTSVSMPETDALDRAIAALYSDYARDKAGELEAAKRLELVKKHVVSINHLTLDGEPVTDFDTFYAQAPKDMVRWICDAVHSSIILTHAERKNFMPGSAFPA